MDTPVSTKCKENAGAMATLVVDRLIVILCGVLLLINGAGVSSVTKRCVHRGEAVKLFSDTGGNYEGVSMYAINQLWIASWSFKDEVIKIEYMNGNYSKRIYMDGNRNVWFLDVERKDAGKYVFKCGIQFEQLDLELTVLEKLTEEQLQECPNKCPGASKMEFETMTTVQYWERYTKGVSHYTSTSVSKGDDKEGVSHYTSMTVNKGDDKEGVRHYTSTDVSKGDDKEGVRHYTSTDVSKGDDKEGSSHLPSENNKSLYWIMALLLVILLMLTLNIIFNKKSDISKRLNSWRNWIIARLPSHQWRQEPSVVNNQEQENREQMMPLTEIHQLWTEHFDTLNWENIRQLLNRDQQQGLQTYCDNLKSVNDNPQQVLETHSVLQHKTEASTEPPTCTSPGEVIELIELCDDTLCKICFANQVSKVCVPCGHLATCSNCSISLQECPVCRREIKALVRPYSK